MYASPSHQEIRARFSQARSSGLRAKEAAEAVGISEGEAVQAHVCATWAGVGEPAAPQLRSVALQGPWIELLQALEPCGPLMALTRNETVVHEKIGVYTKLSAEGPVGLGLGPQIDLRLFFNQWHAAYAVTEAGERTPGSLQFFDAHGRAVHKVYARSASDALAWRGVIERFAQPAVDRVFVPLAPRSVPVADASVDVNAWLEAWAGMTDTHDFFPLLRRFGLERQQALRLAQGRFTHQVACHSVAEALHEASFDGTPIMVFVGSPGCIQIHTGPVQRVEAMDVKGKRWLNVLDADFNLHLREDRLAHCWVVEKPTSDGVVTSLEVFDVDGELVAMLFGARKPGQPELPAWRHIVAHLPGVDAAQVA